LVAVDEFTIPDHLFVVRLMQDFSSEPCEKISFFFFFFNFFLLKIAMPGLI